MSYQSVILADSPDGVWPFDDASGTSANDVSGNNHAGTYSGTFSLGQSGPISGHTAAQFTTNGQTKMSGMTYQLNRGFSVEFLYNSTDAVDQLDFVFASDTTSSFWYVAVTPLTDGRIFVRDAPGGNNLAISSAGMVSGWSHVVVTVDSSGNLTLYVNGTSRATGTFTATYNSGSMYFPISSGNYKGSISYAAHYPAALTSTQVTNHYNAFAAQPPSAPTGLTASGGNTQVTLNWTNAPSATNVNVYRSTSSGTETLVHTGIGNVATYTDTGLTNGQIYYYKVSNTNTGGEGPLSNEASATPTSAASSYSVTPNGSFSIAPGGTQTLTLVANGNTTAHVTASNTGTGTFTGNPATLNNQTNVTTLVYHAPNDGTTTDTISFANDGSLSNPSNITVSILAPTAGALTVNVAIAGAVIATCAKLSGGVAPYSGYTLQRSPDNGSGTAPTGVWSNVGSTAGLPYNATNGIGRTILDSTATAGTIWWYRYQAHDANSAVATSSAVKVTTPAAGAGSGVQWDLTRADGVDVITHAQSLAAANDATMWQPFKAKLDAWLPLVTGTISYSSLNNTGFTYEASGLEDLMPFGLGYIALNGTDPTTAQKYGDRCIGAGLYGLLGNQKDVWGVRKFLARGDGATTAFTIPNSDYVSSTLVVYKTPIQTFSVTHGTADSVDDAGSNVIGGVLIKVSNSNDGTVDYVKGTDYLQNATDYYHTKIDWSQSQTQPANSATYYATYAMQSAATKLTLGVDYTVSGTTITFTSAPSTAYGVSVAYQYGTHAVDYSTLAYQQTYDGLGGVDSTVIDTGGYCCRYLQYLAITLDWLWNYGGMTTARKAVYIYVLLKMYDYVRASGYQYTAPDGNYGAGEYAMTMAIAMVLNNRESARASTVVSQMQTYKTNYLDPTYAYNSTGTVGTNHGGYWEEGWNYGAFAVQNLLTTSMAGAQAGIISASNDQAWSKDVALALIHESPTRTTINDFGDGYSIPAPQPWIDLWYTLSAMVSDATVRSYVNYGVQTYSGADSTAPNYWWTRLLFYNPSATAANWTSALPTGHYSDGTGMVTLRKDWTYASSVLTVHCGNYGGGGHSDFGQGAIEWIAAGNQYVLPLVAAITGTQTLQEKSHYGSVLLVNTEDRRFTDGVTNGTTTITSATGFTAADVGKYLSGTNIALGTTITAQSGTSATMSQAATGSGSGLTIIVSNNTDMTYPLGNNGPAMTPWPSPPNGMRILTYENATNYGYVSCDYHAAYGTAPSGANNPMSEGVRGVFYDRVNDYLVVHDRATTIKSTYTKQLQWTFTSGTSAVSGNGFTSTVGGQTLTAKIFSDAAITTAKVTPTVNGTPIDQIVTNLNTQTAKVRYRTGMSLSAATVTDLPSTDTISEGTKVGNTVVMFGVNGAISGGTSYSITAGNGATVTHYVCDLSPNSTYGLTGATTSSATSSANGVLTFTSTGTGSAQTITLAAPTPATTYTLSALPTSVSAGSSTVVTVSPNGTYTGTITLTPSGAGLSSPVTLTWSGTSTPQTATFSPPTPGTLTIAGTNSGSLSNPTPLTVTVTGASSTVRLTNGVFHRRRRSVHLTNGVFRAR